MIMKGILSGPVMQADRPPPSRSVSHTLPFRSRLKQRIQRSAIYRYFIVKPLTFFRTYLVDRLTRSREGPATLTGKRFFHRSIWKSEKSSQAACSSERSDSIRSNSSKDVELYQSRSPRLIGIKQHLGKGSAGEVREVESPEGVKARKTLKKDKKNKGLDAEFQLLKSLNHPNILKVDNIAPTEPAIAISEDEESEPGFVLVEGVDMHAESGLQMEKADSSLKDLVGKIDSVDAITYTRQLTDALNYLLNQGVAWFDIKPDNLLVKNKNLLLADFGGAVHFDAGELLDLKKPNTSFTTTPVYCSPELWKVYRREEGAAKVDVSKCMSWCLGLTLAELLTGERVFRKRDLMNDVSTGSEQKKTDEKGSRKNYKPVGDIQYQQVVTNFLEKHQKNINGPVLELLTQLLQPDSIKRMSLSEAMKAINHLPSNQRT